jgi:hypothetical protein
MGLMGKSPEPRSEGRRNVAQIVGYLGNSTTVRFRPRLSRGIQRSADGTRVAGDALGDISPIRRSVIRVYWLVWSR